ncbi:MAG: 2-oxoglutarate dehydrogenase complex dihydrolipoyllysine-residue succinyltransferase [Bacteroidales bacterium]|nr:2-oxoglutarate dehydrogenase complex dihydrolipoyllysine-residue succinyltransferase [Bacteroidales bacterium]MCF8391356.1 2-oxoglutarate dehydrogenase complex dihydrolipoyllysine-residue succinyltransferase [Bacteroidales bacterium]
MLIEIKVPSPGESISEVEMANWFVNTGDFVEKDQEIGEIESEKATLPLIADTSGVVEILIEAGNTVAVGAIVCRIDSSKAGENSAPTKNQKPETQNTSASSVQHLKPETLRQAQSSHQNPEPIHTPPDNTSNIKTTPLAKKIMEEHNLSTEDIINGLKKLSSKDVKTVIHSLDSELPVPQINTKAITRDEERNKMSNLRKKLSQRLVAVKNETAMLTTFNEADMSKIIGLRKKYQADFIEKHGVKLGFMSFFTKAITRALQEFPNVNSRIEGEEIVKPLFYDIGIAVQTDKGLMVPVLRNVETLGLAEIEKQIIDFAGKARKNRISIEEMTGGSFTITNGGTFGSMLSTPIINPPQSAILGMHNIIERPVAINGEVVIRPMMYLALSYDHRIIDGRDSVGFLVKVKEYLENPEKMLFEGSDPEKMLLQL